MKKQILHNFFALFLFTSAILFAQTEEHPWQFSFGFNAVDTFPTDAIGQRILVLKKQVSQPSMVALILIMTESKTV
jgi:hypothetical protein